MLYFIAGQEANHIDLDAVGLGYAFEGHPEQRNNTKGVNGCGAGVLLCQRHAYDAGQLALSADASAQTWQRCQLSEDLGEFWVGYWNDKKPTAKSLERSRQIRGKTLVLEGDNWLVPTAVTFTEIAADGKLIYRLMLDQYVKMDGLELTYGDVVTEQRGLWDVASRWMESDTSDQLTLQELWEAAGQCMSYNYRAHVPELTLLNVLTDASAIEIMAAVVDTSIVAESQKKTVNAVLTTVVGDKADSPITVPV